MAMLAWGPMELLLMLLLSGGTAGDLVGLVPPEEYFRFRKIDPTTAKLMELAAGDPKDGAAEIAQLLALRHLEAHPALVAKDPQAQAHLAVLADIADGKKAQDPRGFARDFALRTLVALGARRAPDAPPAPSLTAGLDWFPAEGTLVGAVDARRTRGFGPPAELLDPNFLRLIPPKERDQILTKVFEVLDKIGNIRLERVAVCFVDGDRDAQRVFVRATGKFDRKRLAGVLETTGGVVTETKVGDVPLTRIAPPMGTVGTFQFGLLGDDEAFALIATKRDTADVLQEMLDVRAGKKKKVAEGNLKASLAQLPPKAFGFVVGDVPEDWRRNQVMVPEKVRATLSRAFRATDVQADLTMGNAEAAKGLVALIGMSRDQAIAFLKKMDAGKLPIPGFRPQGIVTFLQSVQLQAQGADVQVRFLLGDDIVRQVPMLFLGFVAYEVRPAQGVQPLPPPKDEEAPKKKAG